MTQLLPVEARILINARDVTRDIAPYVLSVTYTDHEARKSDELSLTLEDTDRLFQGAWRVERGLALEAAFVEPGVQTMQCGGFVIDSVGLSGPPDVVSVRAMAASVTLGMRTKRSQGYESQSLRQIAQRIAQRHALELVAPNLSGSLNVEFKRLTQNKQTDLDFLNRLAGQYNMAFTVKGKQLIMEPIPALDRAPAALTLDKTEISSYTFSEETADVQGQASTSFVNPATGQAVAAQASTETVTNRGGFDMGLITSGDTSASFDRAETQQQAQAQSQAKAYQAQRRERTARLTLQGRAALRAGVNIRLTGFGAYSGTWHIESSTHNLSRSGWVVDLECCQIQGAATRSGQTPAKVAAKPPVTTTRRETNRGGFGLNLINP